MGSAVSCKKRPKSPKFTLDPEEVDSFEENEIDVSKLFSALHKLSFIFELKDSMTTSLISEICSPHHDTFNKQFLAVEAWTKRNSDYAISACEICSLIKYVELYEHTPLTQTGSTDELSSSTHSSSPPAGDVAAQCGLVVPFRSDIAAWTAEIRGREVIKASPLYADTSYRTVRTCASTVRTINSTTTRSTWSIDYHDHDDDDHHDADHPGPGADLVLQSMDDFGDL